MAMIPIFIIWEMVLIRSMTTMAETQIMILLNLAKAFPLRICHLKEMAIA